MRQGSLCVPTYAYIVIYDAFALLLITIYVIWCKDVLDNMKILYTFAIRIVPFVYKVDE